MINIDDVLMELETAIDNNVSKGTLLSIIARSANLPKPLLAMAYIRLQRMSDDELRSYARQALLLVRRMQAGEPLDALLREMGIPDELKGVINSYAKVFYAQAESQSNHD